jgi:hypothetical protein
MIELAKDPAVTDTTNLLTHYGFDLGGYSVEQLLDRWLRNYPVSWLRPAAIEALYQGRYKAVSVEQILTLWRRRGQPLQHFNHEFERILCSRLPHTLMHIAMSKPKARSPVTMSESQPDALTRSSVSEISASEPSVGEPSVNLVQLPVFSEASEPGSDLSATSELPVKAEEADRSRPPQLLLPRRSDSPNSGSDPAPSSQSGSSLDKTDLNKTNLILWSDGQGSKLPIHRFVPAPSTSGFYIKLKAVAHSES